MKKIYLLSLLTIGTWAANAQFNKGQILLGGQVGYSTSTYDLGGQQPSQKNKGGNFNIAVGKAIKENAVWGIGVGYSPYKTLNNFNGTYYTNSSYNNYDVHLFYRQYKKLGNQFYFFAEAGGGYTGGKQTTGNADGTNEVTYRSNGARVYVTPGIAYAICKKLQVEIVIPDIAHMHYSTTNSVPTDTKQHQFSIGTSLNANVLNSLGIGFQLVL